MLRRHIIIYGMLILFLIITPNQLFAEDGTVHVKSLIKMIDVPIKNGGLGGKLTTDSIEKIQNLIDQWGIGGGDHRNNGSHDFKTFKKQLKKVIKENRWNKKALKNLFAIHNMMDMGDKGLKGANGWLMTSEKQAQAKEVLKKIKAGESVKIPKWATKAGPHTTTLI